MYRTRKEMTKQWAEEGGKPTKSDWFRKSGATSVFNVPATKNLELALAVEEVLYTGPGPTAQGGKAKVQEKPGTSVRSSLMRANLFPRDSCGKGNRCPWTARGEACRERCYRESIGYIARCLTCRRD